MTQGEYLSIMNTNPSDFPGDLSRPASSVSWFDATNYCWKLTQRELAAGRIPAGSEYRLPTEAEWECAARAGTTTRFSYGDDPAYASLTNHAWFFLNTDLTLHPVGQKLPNPWGLYDMAGNVWEWCQDWYADQTGGVQTDPTGPASNPTEISHARWRLRLRQLVAVRPAFFPHPSPIQTSASEWCLSLDCNEPHLVSRYDAFGGHCGNLFSRAVSKRNYSIQEQERTESGRRRFLRTKCVSPSHH